MNCGKRRVPQATTVLNESLNSAVPKHSFNTIMPAPATLTPKGEASPDRVCVALFEYLLLVAVARLGTGFCPTTVRIWEMLAFGSGEVA